MVGPGPASVEAKRWSSRCGVVKTKLVFIAAALAWPEPTPAVGLPGPGGAAVGQEEGRWRSPVGMG